jgi:hypothetical protein
MVGRKYPATPACGRTVVMVIVMCVVTGVAFGVKYCTHLYFLFPGTRRDGLMLLM